MLQIAKIKGQLGNGTSDDTVNESLVVMMSEYDAYTSIRPCLTDGNKFIIFRRSFWSSAAGKYLSALSDPSGYEDGLTLSP